MSLRKTIYFSLCSIRGQQLGKYYRTYHQQDQQGIPPDTTKKMLIKMLSHCEKSVPYYSELMQGINASFRDDPIEYLQHFPILTKKIIRNSFDSLKSMDLEKRKWYYNTSGGSTGEPVRFIQDWDFAARSGAIKLLYSELVGREVGEPEILLWGSLSDITSSRESFPARFANWITNTKILSVFRMTPGYMREVIHILNAKKPDLIVAYASAIYELAKFAEKEDLFVARQNVIMSSAYTLFPFMRELIEKVFQCRVYNRYGSREVGDIASERPGYDGLWVAPWGAYVEIVDADGKRVPHGSQGEILVTSLQNYAMPLIRYKIGDTGTLSPLSDDGRSGKGQFLQEVLGRSNDDFINKNGVLVDTGFFKIMLYFRDWIMQYQVIQKRPDLIVFKFVTFGESPQQSELDEIAAKAQLIMGADCEVQFKFVDEILPTPSGKYCYIFSEIRH